MDVLDVRKIYRTSWTIFLILLINCMQDLYKVKYKDDEKAFLSFSE